MKAKAILDYIGNYPQVNSWLYFNVILKAPGKTSMITDSDNILQTYIDGSKDREYVFSVEMIKTYDTGTSATNMDSMEEVKAFCQWIDKNNKDGVLPEFPENCLIDEVQVLSEVPMVTVDPKQNIARYMLSMKIPYIERKV